MMISNLPLLYRYTGRQGAGKSWHEVNQQEQCVYLLDSQMPNMGKQKNYYCNTGGNVIRWYVYHTGMQEKSSYIYIICHHVVHKLLIYVIIA